MNIFQSNKNCHPSFDFKSLSISPLIWTYDMSGHFSNLPELWLRACKVDRQVGMFSDRGEQTVFKVWSAIKRRIYPIGETQLLKIKEISNELIFSHGIFAKDQAFKLVKSRLANRTICLCCWVGCLFSIYSSQSKKHFFSDPLASQL